MPDTATKIPLTLEERLLLGEELIVEADWDTISSPLYPKAHN